MLDNIQNKMLKLANIFSENKFIQALTKGVMSTIPITIGAVIFAILSNITYAPLQNLLSSTGLLPIMKDIVSCTTSMLALYMVISISYAYAEGEGKSGKMAALFAIGSFIILMPQTVGEGKNAIAALLSANFGSNGIFLAMITSLFVSWLYCFLMSKEGLKIKMPNSVPPFVSDALEPSIIAIIIFVCIGAFKYVVSLTSYGNCFTMVNTIITQPILSIGATPLGVVIILTFTNFLWWFGIHPSPIVGVYLAVIITCRAQNVIDAQNGLALTYADVILAWQAINMGGTGNTLGLALDMLFAKSEKFKALRKVCIIPNIFNINEPVIFGLPVVFNPIFLIPMLIIPALSGIVVYIFIKLGATGVVTAGVTMPWVTPGVITGFAIGGVVMGVMILLCVLLQMIVYLPFFKIADNIAYKEEQEALQSEE